MFQGGAIGLLLGVVFSAIGVGYIIYGKRTTEIPTLVAGFVLLLFPMFTGTLWVLLVVGVAAILAPWAGTHLGLW